MFVIFWNYRGETQKTTEDADAYLGVQSSHFKFKARNFKIPLKKKKRKENNFGWKFLYMKVKSV